MLEGERGEIQDQSSHRALSNRGMGLCSCACVYCVGVRYGKRETRARKEATRMRSCWKERGRELEHVMCTTESTCSRVRLTNKLVRNKATLKQTHTYRNRTCILTILSGGGLLPTRHSSLPLECLMACCEASAMMMGGPELLVWKREIVLTKGDNESKGRHRAGVPCVFKTKCVSHAHK